MPTKDQDKLRRYRREYYYRNRDSHKTRASKQRKLLRQWLLDYKSTLACQTCGENHIACLDFHHRNPEEKEGHIATLVTNGSVAKLKREIAKCDVLCANCHRKLHWEQREQDVVPPQP